MDNISQQNSLKSDWYYQCRRLLYFKIKSDIIIHELQTHVHIYM